MIYFYFNLLEFCAIQGTLMAAAESINFWNPVINPFEGFNGSIPWSKLAEQSFDFGQRQYQVFDCVDGAYRCQEVKSQANAITVLLKIILLATVILPLVMLVIKCVNRLSRSYVVKPQESYALIHQPKRGLPTCPRDPLLLITSYLSSSKELVALAVTNKTSSVVIRDNAFWMPFAKRLEPKAALLQLIVPIEDRNLHAKEYMQFVQLMEMCRGVTSDTFIKYLAPITNKVPTSMSEQIKEIIPLVQQLGIYSIEPGYVQSIKLARAARTAIYRSSRERGRPLPKGYFAISVRTDILSEYENVTRPKLIAALNKLQAFAELLHQSQQFTEIVCTVAK